MLKILSYPRGLIVSLFTAFHTIFVSAIVLLITAMGMPRIVANRAIRYLWGRFVFWLAGVLVEVRGVANMPEYQGFIALFNHTSLTDIIALYSYLPRYLCFGAKIELFRIPFFGRAMLRMGAIPIDRRLREKVLKLYEAAIPRVAAGEAFALAPEGTRQTQERLGKFKAGPFLFGLQAQIDLVPVVIAGAFDVLPNKAIWLNVGKWRRKIVIEILPPVSTKGMTERDLDRLQSQVHDQMETTLERLKSELRSADTTFVKNR